MKLRIGVIALVLVLCLAFAGFAQVKKSDTIPWLVAFNAPGSTNVSVSGGYTYYGFGAEGTLNLTLGQFDLGPIPLTWGATVLAEAGFTSGFGLGAGAFFTVDWGFDFSDLLKFELRFGLGPGVALGFSGTPGFGIGIGQYASWTWWFSKSLGVTIQDVYAYTFMGPNLYAYTLGVEFKL